MATKKAKITGYRSPLVAVGTIDGASAVVRVPVNITAPAIGSEVLVREYGITQVLARDGDGKVVVGKLQTETVWIHDPALASK